MGQCFCPPHEVASRLFELVRFALVELGFVKPGVPRHDLIIGRSMGQQQSRDPSFGYPVPVGRMIVRTPMTRTLDGWGRRPDPLCLRFLCLNRWASVCEPQSGPEGSPKRLKLHEPGTAESASVYTDGVLDGEDERPRPCAYCGEALLQAGRNRRYHPSCAEPARKSRQRLNSARYRARRLPMVDPEVPEDFTRGTSARAWRCLARDPNSGPTLGCGPSGRLGADLPPIAEAVQGRRSGH